MDIEEYMKIKHSKRKNFNQNNEKTYNKKIKYLKNLITRVLISIILVLSLCIFHKINDRKFIKIHDNLFESSLEFTKINNWYQKNIGKLIPEVESNSSMVFSDNDLKNSTYEKYLNGTKINIEKGSPISLLYGGIVVFIGEKEGYGNTLILQGNNGIDYWYGGITNINVNLYDYLDKDSLIGETKDNYLYLVLQKGDNYLNYEEIL